MSVASTTGNEVGGVNKCASCVCRYHDQICKDIGVPHRRKGNPLAELFMPYNADDYKDLFK